jgi:hypothetical protein
VRRAAIAACAIGAFAAGLVAAVPGTRSQKEAPSALEALPPPVPPAFVPGPARLHGSTRFLSHYAPVLRQTIARGSPSAEAPPVAAVATRTPEETANIVEVLDRRRDGAGRLWVKVSLSALPNGLTGWVPRAALGGYGTVDTHLVVDLERLTAILTKAGSVVFRARIGVGQPRWPTPRGRFYVRNRLTRFAGPTYGPAGVRDERALRAPDGLARRRVHRHPRHGPAAAYPRPHLPRLHPHE